MTVERSKPSGETIVERFEPAEDEKEYLNNPSYQTKIIQ